MKLKDYLHYYTGCDVITTDDNEQAQLIGVTDNDAHLVHDGTGSYGTCDISGVKPLLRRLEDMTEEQMIQLIQCMVPDEMEDKPANEEYILNLFHNDGGNLVNNVVLIGAEYNVRCYEGQITIKKCGTIAVMMKPATNKSL